MVPSSPILVQEQGAAAALAERAAEVPDACRFSFQDFVLRVLRDEVLAAASARLQAVSRGRDRLRCARDAGDQRTAAGLDLLVEDG